MERSRHLAKSTNITLLKIKILKYTACSNLLRAKLHYTDTGYGHHQWTRSQQFYNKVLLVLVAGVRVVHGVWH